MIKTTIQWATPYSLGLVLTLAIAAALIFAVLHRVAGGPLDPSKRRALWILRGAIFAVLLLILLNPVRVQETPGSVERPKVVYLVDTSQSMALGKSDKTRWDQVVSTVRDSEAGGKKRHWPANQRVPVRQPPGGGRLAVLATAGANESLENRPSSGPRGRTASLQRPAPGPDRLRHTPDRLARILGRPVRPGPPSSRRRLLRWPGQGPGTSFGDRPRVLKDEGADPRRPGGRRGGRR